jgi:septation ring formation regulator EzrA
MTQDDRINRMENQLIDMRLAVSALLETVTQHQRNFETVQRNFETVITEIRDIRLDMREMRVDMQEMRVDMQEMQSEVRGLQTENRRILDILQNRHNNGDS